MKAQLLCGNGISLRACAIVYVLPFRLLHSGHPFPDGLIRTVFTPICAILSRVALAAANRARVGVFPLVVSGKSHRVVQRGYFPYWNLSGGDTEFNQTPDDIMSVLGGRMILELFVVSSRTPNRVSSLVHLATNLRSSFSPISSCDISSSGT